MSSEWQWTQLTYDAEITLVKTNIMEESRVSDAGHAGIMKKIS